MKSKLARRDLLKVALGGTTFVALAPRIGRAEDAVLRLGALYPLTGTAASFGIQQTNGIKLAAQFVNEAGGVKGRKVDFVFADATNNATAVAGAARLVQSKVPLIFGTASSGLSLAASPVAERAGVVYVETGAINAALTHRGFKSYFRTRGDNEIFARQAFGVTKDVIAPRLKKSMAEMTAVVLHEDGPFGTEVGQIMPEMTKRLGGPKILAVDSYNIGETKNYGPLILHYQNMKPDVIYWAAYPSDSILFWRQAKQQGYTPPSVVAFSSGPGTPDFLKAIGKENTNGIVVLDVPLGLNTSALTPAAAATLDRFEKAYKANFPNQPVTGNAAVGFAGGWITLKYILPLAAEFTPAAIRTAFHKVDLPEGTIPTGWGAKFSEGGQNTRAFPIALEWQDGNLVAVWPQKWATAAVKNVPLPGSR